MKRISRAVSNYATGLLVSAAVSTPALSGQLNLSDIPLYLGSDVPPNVFFEVDDSGSMDWEITTRKYWHFCAYHPDFNGSVDSSDCGWVIDNGLWRTYTGSSFRDFEYLYPNSDNAYSNGCNSGREALLSCNANLTNNTPYQNDWRILSAAVNVTFYNPSQDYPPWAGPCLSSGGACSNASFTAARSDPREGSSGYTLSRDLTGFVYEVWVDDRGYASADSRPRRGSNVNATTSANGEVDLWDSHIRYTINANSVTVETIHYAPDTTSLNPSVTTTTLSGSQTDTYGNTVTAIQQNVANWYQYHRKRAYVTKAAIATVMADRPDYRFGLSVINNHASLFTEVPATGADHTTHNSDLLANLFSYNWPASGTPLRSGLKRTGDYFDNALSGKSDPITLSCQKNFAILLTDGYWNGSSPGIGDSDGDTLDNTLADVARHYYLKDLSPLANEVPPDPFDPATHQHMVTFGVAFGVNGNLVDSDGDGWPNPALSESSDWGNPFNGDPEKIDDLWHASYNGRGTFLSASTPQEVVDGLQAALNNIADRTSATASVSLNTGHISSDTLLYQARFDSIDWHGQLLAYRTLTSGALDPVPAWDAGSKIPTHASRTIITSDGSNGIPFRWTSLTVTQQGLLDTAPGGSIDGLGSQRLDWLRGDPTHEQQSGGSLRNRSLSKLGDIIHSAPVHVGAPAYAYPDHWGITAPESCSTCRYSDFAATHATRTPMVYAGANDGMLHGFDATPSGGSERLAFVPNTLFANLTRLTAPNYSHRFYVDGSPTAGDVFFNSDQQWHTVLTGGLNHGGQGVYALDITDPATFSESNAATLLLWEFTDRDDADLGYSYSQPALVRMHNGKWAAIFGNGYNNSEADGHASTSGHAVLYILFIDQGADGSWNSGDFIKLDTGVGSTTTPNGLATPAPVDIDGDRVVDYIYAGDLQGNLWKFDVTGSSPNQWDSAFSSGGNPTPLFTASDSSGAPQPITSRPEVGRGPDNRDLMIYFGTGRFLQGSDIGDLSIHSFYAIHDKGVTVSGRSALQPQTILHQGVQGGYELRVTSNNAVPDDKAGWYLDLLEPSGLPLGERVIANPLLRNGRIIFTTMIPESSPCAYGGSSWLMEIDAITGSRLNLPPFDLNDDGHFNDSDKVIWDSNGDGKVDGNDTPTSPSGKRSQEGITAAPGVLSDNEREYKYASGSTGNIEITTENPGFEGSGRQSWRQLK